LNAINKTELFSKTYAPVKEKNMKHAWKTVILKEILFCLSKNTYIFHGRQEFHVFDQNSGIKPHILARLNFPFVKERKKKENIFL
jgi:hypothetical protein